MTPKWLQKLREQRKIKEQQQLIKELRRTKNQRRRPAAKMTINRGPR